MPVPGPVPSHRPTGHLPGPEAEEFADRDEQQKEQPDREEQPRTAKAIGGIGHDSVTSATDRQLAHPVALRPTDAVDREPAQDQQVNDDQCRQWYYPESFPKHFSPPRIL